MVATRNTRDDVVQAAGRLFADKGYHGTSMRELGKELGLLGSSLYSHVDSKQDLLVAVVRDGARLFSASAEEALSVDGSAADQMRALIAGHVDVVVDNIEVARTFLNEARMLEPEYRQRVLEERDAYEAAFRQVLARGVKDGSFRSDIDPKTASIFILSMLNAVERWYRPSGDLDRSQLVDELARFTIDAVS